jgi:hypothetical protein
LVVIPARLRANPVAVTFCLFSLAGYAVSFFLPIVEFSFGGSANTIPGHVIFQACLDRSVWGWNELFTAWLANPIFWLGLTLFVLGQGLAAATAAMVAVLLGSRYVFNPGVIVGYYVWLGSMALLLFAGVILVVGEGRTEPAKDGWLAWNDPAIDRALEKTGRLLPDSEQHVLPERDRQAEDAAIRENDPGS